MNGQHSRPGYCSCKPPRPAAFADGRIICECGDLVPDPALLRVAGELSKLDRRFDRLEQAQKREGAPRLALNKSEAAKTLGICIETFNERVLPHVKVVRLGREVRIPVTELERFLAEHASLTIGGG